MAANIKNSTTNLSVMAFQIRTGGSIGSGTVFYAVNDEDAIGCRGTSEIQDGGTFPVEGLTPGATYNCQTLFRVNAASTGTYLRKHLTVAPVI